ncbi:MAG: HAD family hydrolase [Chloroflexi bacterium]|nr:HAD family hydrolase [Chloroflexota bacterium]
MAILISFDIDGTLEVGDPPGGVTMEMVRQAQGLGCLIGSCSDRTVSEQRRIWRDHGIEVEFTVLKHRLKEVKERFPADEYYHVGDTEIDRRASLQAGFNFLPVEDAVVRLLNGLAPQ